jgi:hypothetical protein
MTTSSSQQGIICIKIQFLLFFLTIIPVNYKTPLVFENEWRVYRKKDLKPVTVIFNLEVFFKGYEFLDKITSRNGKNKFHINSKNKIKNIIYKSVDDFVNIYSFSLTLTFTPHQTGIFLEILFKIRNQHKILRKKVDFFQTPKNNFSDPQPTNPNKTRRKHF